jgi:hypothetical protein
MKRGSFALMATTVPKAVQVRRHVGDVPPPRVAAGSLPAPSLALSALSSRSFSTASRAASIAISRAIVARVGDTKTMEDHCTTWARLRELARECFPDDEIAVEIAVRETFNVEEAARAVTRLREELCEDLREEGHVADDPPDNSNKVDDEDYVNLDNDDLVDLPDDAEAEEAVAKQRALMALVKMKCHDESARRFMVADRRVARLAMEQEAVGQSAHRRNMEQST